MFATLDLGIRRLPLQQSLKLGRGLNHQLGYKELGWTTTAPLLSFKFGQMLLLIGSSGYNHVSCHCQSAMPQPAGYRDILQDQQKSTVV
ncbi:hypothetical protein V6N11_037075 [Hibiscus sabdariffa]|uniref:Uncharacterized protein n=1 Tax=Hibiscus sabdariffa TaxID=183260 RepID=A0ABR2A935_9ROSI